MPSGALSWLLLGAWVCFLVFWLVKISKQRISWNITRAAIFIGFLGAGAVGSLFFGILLPAGSPLPPPGILEEPITPALMLLLTAPIIAAIGILGVIPGVVIAILCGVLYAMFHTHFVFTVMEFAFLALLYAGWVRQSYRTPFYRALRHPFVAALLIGPIYIIVYIINTTFGLGGDFIARLDYALTHAISTSLAMWGMWLAGGLLLEIVYLWIPNIWQKKEELVPSPAESSLQVRFFAGTASVIGMLLLTLVLGDVYFAWKAARDVVTDRLESISGMAAKSLPFFLETGQNLILQVAKSPEVASLPPENQLRSALAQQLRSVPYFRQLTVFDTNGESITGYPDIDSNRLNLQAAEKEGIRLALRGVLVQTYTANPVPGERTAQVTFIASIFNAQGIVQGVLLGRTDLESNPFTQPVIGSLQSMAELDGLGIILDDEGRILYHPSTDLLMKDYWGSRPADVQIFDETASDGTRNLVYFQPIFGKSWSIVLLVPARQVQQQALRVALPLFAMILIIAALALLVLRYGLQSVTQSLRLLGQQTNRIAQGQLDHPLPQAGVDEVGQLSQSFEQMRLSLRRHLDELNRLLRVSQGVASSLEIEDVVQPILQAAMLENASCVRIVLTVDPLLEGGKTRYKSFGLGKNSESYSALDEQIILVSQKRDEIHLPNLTRGRGFLSEGTYPLPGSLFAVALRHENQYYGTLWQAFDQPRVFTDAEIRFLSTLAGQAALAAANARLYQTAEVGRQRLEGILAATPDPVLVTDYQNNVLLSNPAALQVLGNIGLSLSLNTAENDPVKEQIIALFKGTINEPTSKEINFPNGKVYYATVSNVETEGKPVGKICVMRDITHFKEVDSLKSEFVATVSHDLRSPLTLMKGYATMLPMVGELTDQQKTYVRKIMMGVENMTKLVNNLLDLGRIDAGVGLKLENVSPVEIADRVISQLQMQAAQKTIRLQYEPSGEDIPIIQADPALITQALFNLVENAVKYTPVGGKVWIRILTKPNSVVFDVNDTGTGIAPLDQPRLFERFYRGAQRETYKQKGSGLGLAIVKSIAERHGGRAWLESQLGKGSTFFLEIPRRQPEKDKTTPITYPEETTAGQKG